MLKTIKKVVIGSLSVLFLSFMIWVIFLLNPNLSYAHSTTFDQVTIYHNQTLEENTEEIVKNAIRIIQSSELYHPDIPIQLCLNDGSIYPELHPFKGAIAYAFLNKSVIYHSQPNFQENITSFSWEINNYELRKANLTWMLAHEFTHNLQYNWDAWFPIKYDIWKQEGYAEYIARQAKNDGLLKEKITKLQEEEKKAHLGIPVFLLKDGTIQGIPYFKYALMTQYLVEQEGMNFQKICEDERSFDQIYNEMITWSKS